RGTDGAAGSAARDAEHDRYLADTARLRAGIRRRLPALVRPPRIPPVGRLVVTSALIGWALGVGRLADRVFRPRLGHEQRRARTYRRLRRAAERLGPSYIKLAQLIAAGEGVFPDALVAECRACRDRVPALEWGRIRRVLEADLGPLHERFAGIDPTPLAAASIAQVHAATLADGTPVVVKVQRPRIARRIERDIAVLAWAAPRLVGRIPIAALANPPALVDLFAETISEELDFRVEVANLIEVDRALRAGTARARSGTGAGTGAAWHLPDPRLDAVTKRVIVMSRVPGRPLSELRAEDLPAGTAAAVFGRMTDALLEGTCVHGVFHGDFHAGNVFVDEHGTVGLVDFGITGRLEGARRIAFLRYVIGLLTGDVAAQVEGMADLGAFAPGADVSRLVADLGLDRPDFDPLELTEEEFVSEFRALISGLLASGARIPKELMLFIKNFAYMTSVVGALDPDMDILAQFERTATSFVARNGVRMAGEIGFAVRPDHVTEAALRQAMGVSTAEREVTWRLLRRRRAEMTERIAAAPPARAS
ncbi:MAG TPA: ABC transporter, partial [Acidimicrobiaceae bacterium]|nr:ABC transporter [Acidimicrobiaceae bacterium]